VKAPAKPKARADAPRRLVRVHAPFAREIGIAIVSGRLRPGHVLGGEIEASSVRKVSRTAYREAITMPLPQKIRMQRGMR